jgi:phosphate transport system substrate-binding protein
MTVSRKRRLQVVPAAALVAALVGVATLAGTMNAQDASPSAAPSAAASPVTVAGPATCVDGSITSAGSTALQPLIEAAAEAYSTACPNSTINVQGGGSGTGLTQVSQGAVDIGASDVFAGDKLATPDADALVDHQVVRQGWLMITSLDVTGVTNLSTDQAKQIWTGAITNWKDVGGPDEPIVLILRPASSGTRATFKKIVLGGADEATGQALTEDSSGAVATAVAQTPGSTSVLAFAYFLANPGTVNGLSLDNIVPSLDNLSNGTYALQGFGHLYTKGTPDPASLTQSFLDYMASDQIQNQLAPSLGYAPVNSATPMPSGSPSDMASPAAS